MIPKIIHYVWFGGVDRIPKYQKQFIKEWETIFSDYRFMFWDEDSFFKEFGLVPVVDYCRKKHKFAFAGDFIRLAVLERYGGIYLDTDVKVFKTFNDLLDNKAFLGYIFDASLGTAIIGSEPNVEEISDLKNLTEKVFENNNTLIVSNDLYTQYFLNKGGFTLNGRECITDNGFHIYPRYFFEKRTAWYRGFKGGYSRHYSAGSWLDSSTLKSILKKGVRIIIGDAALSDLYNRFHLKKLPYYEEYLLAKRKKICKKELSSSSHNSQKRN